MKKRIAKLGEKIFLIKVIISDWWGHVRGMPYRTLAIPEGFSLYELAEAIVDSIDFDFDHCFGFYDNIKKWIDSKEGYELFPDLGDESNFPGVKKTPINIAFNEIKKKMLFFYDYGDQWHFIVQLKGIESPKKGVTYPFVVESVGEAPPQYGEWDEEDEDDYE